ncbi:MAG: DUF3568 family protein [Candidatus Omnitrophica bacterium]|jgi:hypothetical protein|nr:DUF3568 family protein [Candidatus Omnitrophota bacterium]
MKKLLLAILGVAALVSVSGCAGLILGTGTLSGMGLAMDTIRLERYVTMDQAWTATKDTLEEMNVTITAENPDAGTINAELEKTVITITLVEHDAKTVSIDVKARRKGLPRLQLAEQIIETINAKLRAK